MMPPTVLTIGNFDGVHLGHRAIIARARRAADARGAGVVALAFSPHPASILRPESTPALLTTFDHRAALLRHAGADEVVRIEPTPALLAQPARAFIAALIERYSPVAFVEGDDFRFGHGRAGDVALLRTLGQELGFDVHIAEPVEVALTDQHVVRASSTQARRLIELGRVRDAALVLGRPYSLTGVVVRGDRRGRTIGCPTANLITDTLLPADGVYAGTAHLPDGSARPAAIHVGPRDTFDQPERVVEAHVLDWKGPDLAAGQPEYHWPLALEFNAWLRDLARFDGADPLMAQISRDIGRTRELVAT